MLAVLAHPVIPESTQKIWEQLGLAGKIEEVRIDRVEWGALQGGTRIGTIEAVFPRADKKEVLEKIEAMENEIRNPGAAAPVTSHESQVTSHGSAASQAPAARESSSSRRGSSGRNCAGVGCSGENRDRRLRQSGIARRRGEIGRTHSGR